ncbi:helix-turn-helix domain-containing protein [Rugosimonospora acidiphila]|uniref:Helix-turn-helix domain-containing protein n=1 Tax=Rugosimonospora acidiphila TaxID=556531 RepID=A0ABP9S4C6_9ACTN
MSVESIGVLREPARRAVYEYAVDRGELVSRDEVAQALGMGRTLAAFHLDRLADAGLLEVSYARRSGRSGPGAGRPAKLYRRSDTEHEVSLPPRRYQAAAGLLAEALERSGADERLFEVARERGRAAGDRSGSSRGARRAEPDRSREAENAELVETLAGQGYEPARRDGSIVLRNCPYHGLARDFPPLVCGMNLASVQGLIEGLGCRGAVARMAPEAGGCCVVIDTPVGDAAP